MFLPMLSLSGSLLVPVSDWPDVHVCFVGFLLPAVLLIATGYVDCNAALAVFLIITAVGFSGISFGGWSVNHLDLAPSYAGQKQKKTSKTKLNLRFFSEQT